MNQSVEFLKVIDEVQKREIPEYVLRRAKQSLLDYLAVSSAGAVFQKEKIDNYRGLLCRSSENSMRLVQGRGLH